MNVVVIGSGYVGLVTGCCLAEVGNAVTCVDHDRSKVATLQAGTLPFHEPELEDLLRTQQAEGRLSFETNIARAMRKADVVFLAVGTPPQDDGNANLDNLLRCAQELADTAFDDCVIIIKSTVPVGTGDKVEAIVNDARRPPPGQPRLRVASNPEFLAEGRAVKDFREPSRVVIGTDDPHAIAVLKQLYAPFVRDDACLMVMDRRSAEFAKYACNAMLAARISVVNELANLAGGLGADIMQVCRVLGSDTRIGSNYLQPGAGYGGSCLPKDLHALIYAAQRIGQPTELLRGVQTVNQRQRDRLFDMILAHFDGDLSGKRIAIWGLAFKPGTDDVRAAPSLSLIRRLLARGARISAYDPAANGAAAKALATGPHDAASRPLAFRRTALHACRQADALVLMTEWDEFRHPDFEALSAEMAQRVIFDGRGLYSSEQLHAHGFEHHLLAQGTATLKLATQNRHTSVADLPQKVPPAANPDASGPG